MAEGEVIVIANPEETTTGGYSSVATGGGGGAPGAGPGGAVLQQNQTAANNSVVVGDDAQSDEVVVIANSMKRSNLSIYNQITPGRVFNVPCLGTVDSATLRKIFLGLQFRVTTRDFGEGRGGENLAASNKPVFIDINKDAFIGYSKLVGGLNYLTLHEIAHSIKEMRDFNQSQFNTYSRRVGSNISLAQRKAEYPKSPEFAENEARANAIAKAIADSMNNVPIGFEPKHGFQTTC